MNTSKQRSRGKRYWQTSATELVALAPRAPYILTIKLEERRRG